MKSMRLLRKLVSVAWWRSEQRWVLLAAALMILVQLATRSWAAFNAWFQYDDLAFVARVTNEPFGWEMLFASHNSHSMPAGFLLTWINTEFAPWVYWPFAAEMMVMQLLANVGAVVFLVSAFGRRPGILPPLAIFLFTVFTMPADIWWAVGVNQLPTVAAIFWAGWSHLGYLRTGRLRWAVTTMAFTLVALAFQERALVLFVVFAFLALAYFATGDLIERGREVVRRYRWGVVLYGVTACGYVGFYVSTALQFDPGTSRDQPLAPLITEMGAHAVATGLVGGPLRWTFEGSALGFPAPVELFTWLSVAVIAYVGYILATSRGNSKRVWWLLGGILATQILLVSASRSFLVGPQVGRDYRYTTEIAPIAALTLALAVMPLLGAVTPVTVRRASALLDRPWRAVIATAAVAGLATYSCLTFADQWHDVDESKVYLTNASADLRGASSPIPLADSPVPNDIFPGFALAYPRNMSSRMFKVWDEHTYYPTVANDRLYIAAQNGEIKPVIIDPLRRVQASGNDECPYPIERGRAVLPLNAPVLGIEWWARITYYSEAPGELRITAGDIEHETDALAGLHSLFFTAQADGLDEITFETENSGQKMCISELELGTPYAVGDEAPQ